MTNVSISNNERVIITRQEGQNQAQYQRKETNGWETKLRRSYDPGVKCKIVEDIVAAYNDEVRRKKAYNRSKLELYH
ncbi:hypothetical protein [Dyadobacter bucti]|uniref:hypothetical protein n=1 Tax=Dyadobacter bucti TaxID=2572203 RepID=UPI001108C85E|nr:hypothetical protein [Dyadobacter bucti]